MTNKFIVDRETLKLKNELDAIEDKNPNIKVDIAKIQDRVFTSMPSGEYKVNLLFQMLINYNTKSDETTYVEFFQGDINFLSQNFLAESNLTENFSENNENTKNFKDEMSIKLIFYALIVYSRLHPHDSGWIKLDFYDIMRTVVPEKDLEIYRKEDLSYLSEFGLQFRVVGSKQAVPCYKLPAYELGDSVGGFYFNLENSQKFFKEIINQK